MKHPAGNRLDIATSCSFCEIISGAKPASVVLDDDRTLAFIDLRQANPGHVLVVPKIHINDVRDLDAETGASLMKSVSLVARAVGNAFPNDGISLWHSIGEAAFQEIPHLHIHIHPRLHGDNLLRVYESIPEHADAETRDRYAALVRKQIRRQQS